MLIPLYGFVEGDSLGVLVLVRDSQRVRDLIRSLQNAASPRVAPSAHSKVLLRGRELDADATIAQAGLTPLDRVDLVREADRGV